MKCKRTCVSPAEKLQIEVQKLLEDEGISHVNLIQEIPRSWEKYGDFLLFNGEKFFQDPIWMNVKNLWNCISEVLKVKRIGIKYYIQKDIYRSPQVKMVLGSDSWIQCKDNGITYSWDVQYNMFSAGNAPERHRIATLPCENEVIVDMFAGIGYFTLPYLVKCKAKVVHACEWNPRAVKALKINLQKNKVAEKCIVYEGDCKIVCPKYLADKVNLGLLPSSEPYWEIACVALNPHTGGTLLIHENVTSGIQSTSCKKYTSKDCKSLCFTNMHFCKKCHDIIHSIQNQEKLNISKFFENMENNCSLLFNQSGCALLENITIKWKKSEWKMWTLHVCHKLWDIFEKMDTDTTWLISASFLHHVKSYAPHIDHLVLDVKCLPVRNL